MNQILLVACTAAFNPTLLTATTVMLLLDNPKRLLLGYLCGAYLTSITLGLLIVFELDGSSSATSTAQNTVSPVVDIVFGVLFLVVAFVVGTGRDTRRRARSAKRKAAKADKAPPKWQQKLSTGTARTTFVIGALLTLPGGSYLAGLDEISKQDFSNTTTVLVIIGFNVIMLALLEVPLIGYTLSPEKTARTVERVKAWLSRRGGRVGIIVAVVVGVLLVVKGVAQLVT